MQEFTSISVSSYEAGSLADRLTEQSSAGWAVVAIVPTGSTVTAYLSRDAGSAAKAETVASEPATATETSDAAKSGVAERVEVEQKPEPTEAGAEGETVAGGTGKVDSEAESKAESRSPVDEPGGWAIAPEAAKPTPTAESTSAAASTAGAVTPTPASTSATTSATTPTSTTPAGASATPAAATPAAATTTQTASAAPAGWYADPSSRYELRYWDGTQWTEHVSRSGQQFTDPPVA